MIKKSIIISLFICVILFVSCGSNKNTMNYTTSSGEVKPIYDTKEEFDGIDNSISEYTIKEENILY